MPATSERSFSIGEVSELTGLTPHTLRFYEKEGLFLEPIGRDSAGRRRFTRAQIDWLLIGARLRAAGMPLPEIRRYAEAARGDGDAAVVQLELLREHERRVRSRLADVMGLLDMVTAKIASHEAAATPAPAG